MGSEGTELVGVEPGASTLDDAPEHGADAPALPADGDGAPVDGSSPVGSGAPLPEVDEAPLNHPPAFVITCPHCQTSIPFVPGIEGYEPSKSSKYHTCDECDGFGEVQTGSMVAAHAVKQCTKCSGTGFLGEDGAPVEPTAPERTPPWEGAKWNEELNTWT